MIYTHVGTIQPESVDTYVVYDPEFGEIHHVHEFIIFEGGEKINYREAEARVLAAAQARLPYAGKLRVLRVDQGARQPGITYFVDPKDLCLVPKGRARQV